MEWLEFAIKMSEYSPHPTTQVGAVLVTDDDHVWGCNDFPRGYHMVVGDVGVDVSEPSEQRTMHMIHAEQMAICNAAALGIRTWGATIYQTIMPCCECAKAIIQAGIAEVAVDGDLADAYKSDRYTPQFVESLRMFDHNKVTFRKVYR